MRDAERGKMCPYAINLENISYAYEGGTVLKNLSLKVRAGEHVGILGGVSYKHLTLPTICSV